MKNNQLIKSENQIILELLKKAQGSFNPVIDFRNSTLAQIDLSKASNETHGDIINQQLVDAKANIGIGGYGEERKVYADERYLTNEEPRTIHLGVDIWAPDGTEVMTPSNSVVHSFQDNDSFCNYGPTIILEHQIDKHKFHTLYGHLSRKSLANLEVGQFIDKGKVFAWLGKFEENGNWAPHLHFQVINHMLGLKGDFDGVAKKSEKDYYLDLCPDPEYILNTRI